MRCRNDIGFTLIELLVVIAIVAILASLLMPVLSRAKGRTQRIACLNRLRQWDLAALMYKDDHEEFLPREKCVDNDHTWAHLAAPLNGDVWFNALPPGYLGHRPASAFAADAEGFHRSRVFQCPTPRFPAGTFQPRFSLAINSQLNESADPLQKVRFSAIRYPADTVLYLECGVMGETPKVCPTQKPYNGRPYSWAVRLSARHNRGSNLAFADGHAQWFTGLKVVDPATGEGYPPPSEVLWRP